MASSYAEVEAMTIEQLKREYDNQAATTQVGLNFYREEINRREAAAASTVMTDLTKAMAKLTVIIAVLSVLSVLIAGISLYVSITANTSASDQPISGVTLPLDRQ